MNKTEFVKLFVEHSDKLLKFEFTDNIDLIFQKSIGRAMKNFKELGPEVSVEEAIKLIKATIGEIKKEVKKEKDDGKLPKQNKKIN